MTEIMRLRRIVRLAEAVVLEHDAGGNFGGRDGCDPRGLMDRLDFALASERAIRRKASREKAKVRA